MLTIQNQATKNLDLPSEFAYHVNIWDMMTKTDQKITLALLAQICAMMRKNKDNGEFYFSQKKMAEKVGCCRSTVERYIKKYNFILNNQHQKAWWAANSYLPDKDFFETIWVMEKKNVTEFWHEQRRFIMPQLFEDPRLLMKKWGYLKGVMNIRMKQGGGGKTSQNEAPPFLFSLLS